MVTIKRNNKKSRFIDVEIGAFFEYDNTLFIKTAGADNTNNSFDLETSLFYSFNADEFVTEINDLTITY